MPQSYDELLAQGMTYFQQHEYDMAIDLFERALVADPQDNRALVQLGYVYAIKKMPEEAVVNFEKALSLDPQDALTCLALAEIYRKEQVLSKAEELLERARKIFAQRQDEQGLGLIRDVEQKLLTDKRGRLEVKHPGYVNIERVLLGLGYLPDIAADLAFNLLPIYERMSFRDVNDPELLQKDLERNVSIIYGQVWINRNGDRSINPQHIVNYTLLLNDQRHEEFMQRMGVEYTKLSKKDKVRLFNAFQCSYHSYLGWILLTAKGLQVVPIVSVVVLDHLRRQVNGDTKFVAGELLETGKIKVISVRQAHAALLVKQAGEKYIFVDMVNSFVSRPVPAADYYCDSLLGICELRSSRAGNAFTRIQHLDKKYLRAVLYTYLAVFYTAFQDEPNALSALQHAVDQAPEFDYVHYKMGEYYARHGDYDKAIGSFKRAYRYNPYADYIKFCIAVAYWEQQNYGECIKYMNMAVKASPRDPRYFCVLGMAYAKTKDFVSAFEQMDQAIKIDPDFRDASLIKAQLLEAAGWEMLERGDKELARKRLRESLRIFTELHETRKSNELHMMMLLEKVD